MRDERADDAADGGGRALCATGVDVDGVVVAFIFDKQTRSLQNTLGHLDYVSIFISALGDPSLSSLLCLS